MDDLISVFFILGNIVLASALIIGLTMTIIAINNSFHEVRDDSKLDDDPVFKILKASEEEYAKYKYHEKIPDGGKK